MLGSHSSRVRTDRLAGNESHNAYIEMRSPDSESNITLVRAQISPANILTIVVIVLAAGVGITFLFRKLLPRFGISIPSGDYSVDVEVADSDAARTNDYFRIDLRAVVSVGFKDPARIVDSFYDEAGELVLEQLEDTIRRGAAPTLAAAVNSLSMQELGICSLQNSLDPSSAGASSSFKKYLEGFGLELKSILISEVAENNYYDPENFFDAQALNKRAETIAKNSLARRKTELKNEADIDAEEAKIRKVQLDGSRVLEAEKIDVDRTLETLRLEKERDVEQARIEQEKEIELRRIATQCILANKRKKAHRIQTKITGDSIAIDCDRLEAEKRKVEKEHELNKLIGDRKGERLAAQANREAEIEAAKIDTLAKAKQTQLLAEADGKSKLAEALNKFEPSSQIYQLIIEILPMLLEKMPELGEVLTPQPGVLGDTRIYAFPSSDRGVGLNKLMLSASGLSGLGALLEDDRIMGILANAFAANGQALGNGNGDSQGNDDSPGAETSQNPVTNEVLPSNPGGESQVW